MGKQNQISCFICSLGSKNMHTSVIIFSPFSSEIYFCVQAEDIVRRAGKEDTEGDSDAEQSKSPCVHCT